MSSQPPERPPAEDVVVFGGGHLGAAVARQAAAVGHRVLVASRTPRAHAGLWRAWDASQTPPTRLDGARVVIALAPRRRSDAADVWGTLVPRLALTAWRAGASAVTVCGPAGGGDAGLEAFTTGVGQLASAPRTTVVRFGPLVGVDDDCVWPIVTTLRERGVARLPRGVPPFWPLHLDDAARAIVRLGGAREVVLKGPERLGMEDVGRIVTDRFGGRWAWRWWGGSVDVTRIRAWENLPDDWDDARLGPRQTLASWIGRLPGLRRRR